MNFLSALTSIPLASLTLKGFGGLWSKIMEDGGAMAEAGSLAAKPTEYLTNKGLELVESGVKSAGNTAMSAVSSGFENLGKLVPAPTTAVSDKPDGQAIG